MTFLRNGRLRQRREICRRFGPVDRRLLRRLCASVRGHDSRRILAHVRLQRPARRADEVILLHHFGLYRCCWRYMGVPELAVARQSPLARHAAHHDRLRDRRRLRHASRARSSSSIGASACWRSPAFRALPRLLHDGAAFAAASAAAAARCAAASPSEDPAVRRRRPRRFAGRANQVDAIRTPRRSSASSTTTRRSKHMSIHGFEVLGDRSVLPRIAERLRPIDQIVVAISAIAGARAARDRRAVPAVLTQRAGGAGTRRAVPWQGQRQRPARRPDRRPPRSRVRAS